MAARRKRVQVGWYCNHEDEPYDNRSHMSSSGKYKRGKWIESFPEPHTAKALAFTDYHDPKKRPHCPKAVPAYILIDAEQADAAGGGA